MAITQSVKARGTVVAMVYKVDSTGVKDGISFDIPYSSVPRTFQAVVEGTTKTGTFKIDGSMDGVNWIEDTTLTVTSETVGATSTNCWKYLRVNVDTLPTGSLATVYMYF